MKRHELKSLIVRTKQSIGAKLGAARQVALVAATTLGMSQARAAGWLTAITNVTSLAQGFAVAVTAVAFAAGLVAISYAGKLLWDKGGERGEDIKASRIVYSLIGGAFLFALTYFGVMTVETLGGSASDIGKAPGGL